MYQEIEMYNQYKKEKQIKHKHEVIASISAISFIVILGILVVTFVNQFTIVNIEVRSNTTNVKICNKQIIYFYNVNTTTNG